MKVEQERVGYDSFGRSADFQVFKRVTVDAMDTDYVICTSCNDAKLVKYDTKFGSYNLNTHLSKNSHIKNPKKHSGCWHARRQVLAPKECLVN